MGFITLKTSSDISVYRCWSLVYFPLIFGRLFIWIYNILLRWYWNRELFSVGYWSKSRRNIRIIDSNLFLCNSVRKWRDYTKIAIFQMVRWFPPYHGQAKRHWTSFVIKPFTQNFITRDIKYMKSPFFAFVCGFATEVAFISFLHPRCYWAFSCWKRKFSANITKFLWVVYTVSWQSVGNVTHFKQITSLNLQLVTPNSFFAQIIVGLFVLNKPSPTATSLPDTVLVWPLSKNMTHRLGVQCWHMNLFPSNYFAH